MIERQRGAIALAPMPASERGDSTAVTHSAAVQAARNFLGPLMRFARGDMRGPHRFARKRPRTFVAALQSFAAVGAFRSGSIFEFCNGIGTFETCRWDAENVCLSGKTAHGQNDEIDPKATTRAQKSLQKILMRSRCKVPPEAVGRIGRIRYAAAVVSSSPAGP
jgi:hypothetical protein